MRLRPLRRLIPYVKAHKGDAVLGGIFLVLSSLSLLALTIGLRKIVDQGFLLHDRALLFRVFSWLAVAAMTLALTTGLRIYFLYQLGERVVADLRQAVFRHVLTLDLTHFLKMRTGEVLSRMTTDMTIVEGTVGNVIPVALRNILTLCGALTTMVIVSPNFTGLVLVLIPLLLAPVLLVGRHMQRLSVRAQDRFAEAVGYAGEGLEALETVQAVGKNL
jgi:ATP-binding cassette subfamily B protein